jgi:hypothetical protein
MKYTGAKFVFRKILKEIQKMTKTYSMEKILAMREILQKLPVKEKEKSRAEVVEFLKTDLRRAMKQGHSLKEIQALLAEQGISVSLSRMEAVLGHTGKDSGRKKAGARPRPESQIIAPQSVESHAALDETSKQIELNRQPSVGSSKKVANHTML